jgi:hypothetical protein
MFDQNYRKNYKKIITYKIDVLWKYNGKFCCRTLSKYIICWWTPQRATFAQYHYKFRVLCCNTPQLLFYLFLRLQWERVGEITLLPSSSTFSCPPFFAVTHCRLLSSPTGPSMATAAGGQRPRFAVAGASPRATRRRHTMPRRPHHHRTRLGKQGSSRSKWCAGECGGWPGEADEVVGSVCFCETEGANGGARCGWNLEIRSLG